MWLKERKQKMVIKGIQWINSCREPVLKSRKCSIIAENWWKMNCLKIAPQISWKQHSISAMTRSNWVQQRSLTVMRTARQFEAATAAYCQEGARCSKISIIQKWKFLGCCFWAGQPNHGSFANVLHGYRTRILIEPFPYRENGRDDFPCSHDLVFEFLRFFLSLALWLGLKTNEISKRT